MFLFSGWECMPILNQHMFEFLLIIFSPGFHLFHTNESFLNCQVFIVQVRFLLYKDIRFNICSDVAFKTHNKLTVLFNSKIFHFLWLKQYPCTLIHAVIYIRRCLLTWITETITAIRLCRENQWVDNSFAYGYSTYYKILLSSLDLVKVILLLIGGGYSFGMLDAKERLPFHLSFLLQHDAGGIPFLRGT